MASDTSSPPVYIPTRDLTKKGLRHPAWPECDPSYIPTRDLTKKGLRHDVPRFADEGDDSNERPDKEGIKTLTHVNFSQVDRFQRET